MTTPSHDTPASGVPEVPRPVTPKASRRAWREPNVRFWWIAASLFFVSAIGLAIERTNAWLDETRIVRAGVKVEAIGWDFTVGPAKVKNRQLPTTPAQTTVNLEYEYNGKPYKVSGILSFTGQQYQTGVPFDIRIDPNDPEKWTNLKEPPPLIHEFIGTTLALGVSIFALLITLFVRSRYLGLWRKGEVASARVFAHGNTAIAPRSTAVRCVIREGRKEHVFTVYIPQSSAVPEIGQQLDVATNASHSAAIAVMNYHS